MSNGINYGERGKDWIIFGLIMVVVVLFAIGLLRSQNETLREHYADGTLWANMKTVIFEATNETAQKLCIISETDGTACFPECGMTFNRTTMGADWLIVSSPGCEYGWA